MTAGALSHHNNIIFAWLQSCLTCRGISFDAQATL